MKDDRYTRPVKILSGRHVVRSLPLEMAFSHCPAHIPKNRPRWLW